MMISLRKLRNTIYIYIYKYILQIILFQNVQNKNIKITSVYRSVLT